MAGDRAEQDCASRLKVLADRTRLAVMEVLIEGPRHVHELMDLLDVEQSLLSHHLRVLRDAGLVAAVRDGKAVRYQLAPSASVSSAEKGIHLGCCAISFPPTGARGRGGARRQEITR